MADPQVDVYLESSIPGRRVYEKKGFTVVDWCKIETKAGTYIEWPCMARKAGGANN